MLELLSIFNVFFWQQVTCRQVLLSCLLRYYTVLNNPFIILKVTAQGVSQSCVGRLFVPRQSQTICQDCFSLIMDQKNYSDDE